MAIHLGDLRQFVENPAEVPSSEFESTYDREADVLYVHFERGPADDSDFTLDNVVLRYREGRLIGITILNASTRDGLVLET